MKKILIVLILLIGVVTYGQNTFKYEIRANGGIRVGGATNQKIDSITRQDGKLRIMSGATLQEMYGHILVSDTSSMLTNYILESEADAVYLPKANPTATGTVNLPSDVRITGLPNKIEADTVLVWHNGRVYYSVSTLTKGYYVSNSGNDSNNGLTEATPWKTIAKVNSTTLTAGDRVYFKRGDKWNEQLTIDESGTAVNPIAFTAYGTGKKPIITGADTIKTWTNDAGNVWYANCPVFADHRTRPHSYACREGSVRYTQVDTKAAVTDSAKYFVDTTPSPDVIYVYSTIDPDSKTMEVSARNFAILCEDQTYIDISYLDCRDAGMQGIDFYAVTSQVNGYSTVDSCVFTNNRNVGMAFENGYSYSTVTNCVATYNGNGFYSLSYAASGSDNNTFRRCYSANNIGYSAGSGLETDGHGIAIWDSDDCIVEYCTSVNNRYGIIIDPNGKANDVTFRYNIINTTKYNSPGMGVGGNIPAGTIHNVYYNLIVNTGTGADGAALSVGGTSRLGTVNVFNNTIYERADSTPNGFLATRGTGVNLKNNIIAVATTSTATLAYYGSVYPSSSNYNQYYDIGTWGIIQYDVTAYYVDHAPTGVLADWTTASGGLDVNSAVTDPLFVNVASDWSLQAGSPCINTGTVIATIPQTDILGNPIVGTPDKGCYERQ